MVCRKSQEACARSYLLREEAHESWQYTITDEIVYLPDFIGADDNTSRNVSEIYLKGDVWVEVEFRLLGQRNTKYTAIIDVFKGDISGTPRHLEFDMGTIGGNSPMLVEVTHSVQPPQKILLKGCRSVCWLKVSDYGSGICGDIGEAHFESSFGVGIPHLNDRKLDPATRNNNIQLSQTPDELIEAGAHTVKGIPASEGNTVGNVEQLNCEDVPLIFKIFLSKKSAGIRFVENPKLSIEYFKMTLRPVQFQIGVSQSGPDHAPNDSSFG